MDSHLSRTAKNNQKHFPEALYPMAQRFWGVKPFALFRRQREFLVDFVLREGVVLGLSANCFDCNLGSFKRVCGKAGGFANALSFSGVVLFFLSCATSRRGGGEDLGECSFRAVFKAVWCWT
jgi:hypothetical protein